jgi:RNA polymerase sigma-70 factor (ECF subfamily)
MDDALDSRIAQARAGQAAALGELLEDQRAMLVARAERQLGVLLMRRLSASDVVQQSFLEALRAFPQFNGSSYAEFAAWLQAILEHHLQHAVRDHTGVAKRAIGREEPLPARRPGESEVLGAEFAAAMPSPSTRAMEQEQADQLASLLADLPEDQRAAVRLRYEGMPLTEIAQQLGRSTSAVASLIKRGMQALRSKVQTRPQWRDESHANGHGNDSQPEDAGLSGLDSAGDAERSADRIADDAS